MVKLLSILCLLFFPIKLEQDEYTKMYGAPIFITENVEGYFTYDLSTIDPEVKVLFIVPIKVECKKDTIIIRPGYKKY